MTLEDIRSICRRLRGTTEDIKWEDHLCFNVGGKMYLVTSPDKVPVSASFKVEEDEFEEMTAREGFAPAAYLARYKWVYVEDISRMSLKEWEYYAKRSYSLVAAKLPARIRKELE